MCCDGVHDGQAKLDVPGQVRFVTVCASCGREQREFTRRPYAPAPRLSAAAPYTDVGEARRPLSRPDRPLTGGRFR